ncbi:hypothetical protein SAMN05216355_11819 [Actinomyces ruminicola]|uniref:Excreted virulence factor EspC, type VII ESX diderm n=1 Tax=Actinomyces ruminicola TaxID=332524 RepID=A0A1H0ER77_9ACTO|nr:hypothetical protein [Actinomyces ruminicola]SDN84803.1 hypothetical protein SAMN05216355_11819 [Actinomyces ruminicola]
MADADIHIVGGDLEMLAFSLEELRNGIEALDASGPLEKVGAAMPGSLSSGSAGTAAARLESRRTSLGSRYGNVGEGVRDLATAHRRNDEFVAQGAAALGAAVPSASVDQWARARGLM